MMVKDDCDQGAILLVHCMFLRGLSCSAIGQLIILRREHSTMTLK